MPGVTHVWLVFWGQRKFTLTSPWAEVCERVGSEAPEVLRRLDTHLWVWAAFTFHFWSCLLVLSLILINEQSTSLVNRAVRSVLVLGRAEMW